MFYSTGSLAIVSPWMKRGTIMTYLRLDEYDPRRERLRLVCSPLMISFAGLIDFQIIEIVEGLVYLHSREIAHGGLHGVWSSTVAR
jgi:hypothetical protein